jgi:hypothetical protein
LVNFDKLVKSRCPNRNYNKNIQVGDSGKSPEVFRPLRPENPHARVLKYKEEAIKVFVHYGPCKIIVKNVNSA